MYQLTNDVVYVKGAKNGAIYDFVSGNVYWINSESCELINKLIQNNGDTSSFAADEQKYLLLLEKNNLYDKNFKIKKYNPSINSTKKLEMAWLEITQACNCKCLHCYQGEKHITSTHTLELFEWIRVISQLQTEGVSRVVVIGGEPCIYKYIYDILLELYNKEIKTTLFTNATIINESLMELIIRCADKISVKVSLYGDNAADHDMVTQCPGSFEKLVSNVRKLTTNGVTVSVAVVAMKENQDKLHGIKEFIHSLGARYSKFDVIRNVFGGTQDQHTPTNKEIINSCLFKRPNFKATRSVFDNNHNKNSCWYGKIAITETGDVIPCVFERSIIYGNVKDSSISNILQSQQLHYCWHMNFTNVEYCKNCEFRYACKDCRPLGRSVNGNISGKNPRCKYNPYTGEWE